MSIAAKKKKNINWQIDIARVPNTIFYNFNVFVLLNDSLFENASKHNFF